MMEENPSPAVLEGKITGISFSLATEDEIRKASISDCPISHTSQLSNPFLGLPLEVGRCESCGTAEPGKCEGHFGYIELPIPIYHPSHLNELKRILSLICLKCLKFKNRRLPNKTTGMFEKVLTVCCEETANVTVDVVQKQDGASYLQLKVPSKTCKEGLWEFLERYGYRYGDGHKRPLLPSEVLVMLKKIDKEKATKKKLAGRGCFFQEGYIMQHLPIPPNCLSTPDVSDGINVMSSDISMTMLKKVLRQVEIIKSSRSGIPNFESLEVEVNDLQNAVAQYLQSRGAKASPNKNIRYGIAKELNDSSSTKAWLEKMKTLFISKGSGFSSRSVITGDPYKGVGEIGIPFEIAQRITFEERVTEYNMKFLQKLVDDKLCLTYRDGNNTYSLREGSKGHTFLKPGQVVHRKIMEGDVIFINRPPTTHKHSLQALSVYIHDDHTFKINPLICGPLSADFDGDCIHIFYPQSPEAKAEVLELFAVEKQLLSSHSGNVNLQFGSDSLLSLKTLFKKFFFKKSEVQQLALFTSSTLPKPSMLKVRGSGPLWTVLELLETSLPPGFDCSGERFLIKDSKILKLDYSREVIQSIINDVISSIFFTKGPKEVLKLFNSLQPMLMENLSGEGFNLSLEDFIVPKSILRDIETELQDLSSLLYHLRSTYNEVIALQLDKHLRAVKSPISEFILKYSSMGSLIDSKSDSAVTRIIQQIGFLGLQILEKGRLYSRTLAEDLSKHFRGNYPFPEKYPSEEFGLIRGCLFHGLDPYQELVHSISNREVMVRSSRGLTEPGTLFKNLMAILRDVVICYDGTVRNVCSNSIIQFEYGVHTQNLFAAGEPVGVLAATAMSNPAYKAVLDSSPNSNSSWDMMKEILLCGVNFKNVNNDRRVVLYLNDCDCGNKYCLEKSAYFVKNHLRKVSLKDTAVEFLIEFTRQQTSENAEIGAGLVGHIHLNQAMLKESKINMEEVLAKCEDTLNVYRKKKKEVGLLFRSIALSCGECSFHQSSENKWMPCLKFFRQDTGGLQLEKAARILADFVCPVLLDTIIKGDPRVKEANIIWIGPESTVWIRNPNKDQSSEFSNPNKDKKGEFSNPNKDQKGELAIDVVLEKAAVKKSGDAWRIVMDTCLPIMHLIDTTRSIPYAIKQVEDLLGTSCAFEQAVQRLSTSVSMVSKGMLKEHLLLLANSMTCAGTLVGFNQAGIKALSKTLNFQVPFSEATLYTPKRCFEKAAEKCHSDSLSSIVAACSWGKPVAVGTGSRFDILWDTREVELNQKDGIDVYNFLHLVHGGSEEEADNGCLGGEVDSFDMEDNFMEVGSPEHDSGAPKAVFEDSLELNLGQMETAAPEDGNSSGGWGAAVKTTPTDGWGAAVKSTPTDSSGSWGAAVKTTPTTEGSWGAAVKTTPTTEGSWGAAVKTTPTTEGSWGAAVKATPATEGSGSGWGKKAEEPAWGGKKPDSDTGAGSGSVPWGKREETAWGKKVNSGDSAAAWGKKDDTGDSAPWSKKADTGGSTPAPWGKKADTAAPAPWGKKDDTGGSGSAPWGKKADTGVSTPAPAPWGKKDDTGSAPWGKKADTRGSGSAPWGKKDDTGSVPWGKKDDTGSAPWGKKDDTGSTPWGKKDDTGSAPAPWGRKDVKADEPSQVEESQWGKIESSGSWGKSVQKPDSVPKWGGNNKSDEGSDWSKKVEEKTESKDGWGSQSQWGAKNPEGGSSEDTTTTTNEGEKPGGAWGWNRKPEQKPDQGQGGWKKKEGWGPRRDRPARPAGGPNDGPRPGGGGGGPFTASRQRLDMFTSDEQEILADIEPIMLSIRRIMSQEGYNDGDPLSAEDQTYILENVFNHHPEKAQKMGAGIDYVMVTKHTLFQDSRCLFIVSTDGRKEDFSYRKCLENFVRGKYPDKVDEFMSKYFKKPQPRPPREPRPPGPGQDEAIGTPNSQSQSGWKRGDANDEGGTHTPRSQPGWNRDSGSDAGTPRAQSQWGGSEAGTPVSGSGWKKEAEGGGGWNKGGGGGGWGS
ncbi:DNA-directed RNA polymerase V subunit 1 [Lactuca sativa]|uniref:DNA-directed RNA polymerase V subunit 1 n=1 Tax=Lactuca sativa TaxID=4236 RepID=UPI0022AEF4AE|nr:DNA-directed RNA polymerase V subunit 1 [Lactuca sativa]